MARSPIDVVVLCNGCGVRRQDLVVAGSLTEAQAAVRARLRREEGWQSTPGGNDWCPAHTRPDEAGR